MRRSVSDSLSRRKFVAGAVTSSVAIPAMVHGAESRPRQVLYNGIEQPKVWPPRDVVLPLTELPTPAYLKAPPDVLPIDLGRQLFIDDFLIEQSTLKRTYHSAQYHPATPVLKPDQPWETRSQPNPTSMPFSDGIFYDPRDKQFKLWYMGGL